MLSHSSEHYLSCCEHLTLHVPPIRNKVTIGQPWGPWKMVTRTNSVHSMEKSRFVFLPSFIAWNGSWEGELEEEVLLRCPGACLKSPLELKAMEGDPVAFFWKWIFTFPSSFKASMKQFRLDQKGLRQDNSKLSQIHQWTQCTCGVETVGQDNTWKQSHAICAAKQ